FENSLPIVPAVYNRRDAPSPLLSKEVWPRHQENVRSELARPGWYVLCKLRGLSYHPVCARCGGFAAFCYWAHPPLLGKEGTSGSIKFPSRRQKMKGGRQ